MPRVSDAHRRARRQEILDAAAACFARDGFHRTSMQDIVRESGISAGLVYRYFAGKDDVIAAIVADWHEHRANLLTAASGTPDPNEPATPVAGGSTAPAGPGPQPLLTAYLDLLRAIGRPQSAADLRLGVQVWAEALRAPTIGELVRAGVDGPRALAAEAIRSAEGGGGLPVGVDPDALARVLIAIHQGLTLQTAWDPAVDNEGFVRAAAALLGRHAPASEDPPGTDSPRHRTLRAGP